MNIAQKSKFIGIYQIGGGIIGILNTLRFFPEFRLLSGSLLLTFLPFFALYSFSIYCGYLILKKKYLKGFNLSINNQLLQIIGFAVFGYAFHFTAGIYAGIKLNLTNDTILTFMLGHSAARININTQPELTIISINFMALILLTIILKLKESFEKNAEQLKNA